VKPIIVFSGSSQTGKTTLGRRLADKLHCKFVSFGDFVRRQAMEQGISTPSREDLQNLGQQLLRTDVMEFCRAVLETVQFSPGDLLIADGVRHTEVLGALSTISPGQPVKLIYLDATVEVREARYAKHSQYGILNQVDAHPVERQTKHEIKQLANVVIDANGAIGMSYFQILDWLARECPQLLSTQRSSCSDDANRAGRSPLNRRSAASRPRP
jgi:cytidylate kinase